MPTAVASPSWDSRRNPFGAYVVTQVGEEHGLPITKVLASTGLQPGDLTRTDLEIAAGQELAVIRNVIRWLGDQPGLGADAGARLTLGMLGLWGFAMLNSQTLREAVDVALKYGYGHLSFAYVHPTVEQRHNEVRITLDTQELPHDLSAFLIERDIAAHGTLIPQLISPSLQMRIETTLDRTRANRVQALLPHHQLTAECGHDLLLLPAGILDQRLPFADKYALQRWKQECERLITRDHHQRHDLSAVAAARSAILRDPGHTPTVQEIAHALSISPRTLRRQLASANTKFRSLLDDLHKLLAEDMLGSGATIAETADHLGYADTQSFIRAFKRWTGRTPGTRGPIDETEHRAHPNTGAARRHS